MRTNLARAALLATVILPLAAARAEDGTAFVSQMTHTTLTVNQMSDLTDRLILIPDPLLAQMLPAATFPVEIVVAQRWLDAHPKATPDEIAAQSWPEPLKALAQHPEVLKMMNDDIQWTQSLGKAFLSQEDEVLRSIQRQRGYALKEGKLSSNDQQQVVKQSDGVIVIWPEVIAGSAPAPRSIPPVQTLTPDVAYAAPNYGFVNTAAYGGYPNDYCVNWGNNIIVDRAGLDWGSRLGVIIDARHQRGGTITVVNGPNNYANTGVIVGPTYGGNVYGSGVYGGYVPTYTGNVLVNNRSQNMYGSPTFQRSGYSFTPAAAGRIIAPPTRIYVGGR